jgi:6-phosphofructokinase 2
MNPALDESADVDHVFSDHKLRCGSPRSDPGGGGINVSRALQRLGEGSLAIYPAGGGAGATLGALLDEERLSRQPLTIAGQTRTNLNIRERTSGRQYRFLFPGPTLSPEEWNRCLEALRAIRPPPDFLVASGSLAPGVPSDFYARVATYAREVGTRFLLDAPAEPLRRALEVGIYLAKPSLREFADLLGTSISHEKHLRESAREIVRRADCQSLVVSLGAGGALWATATDDGRVAAPAVSASSSVGAGDSLLAGIVFFLVRGRPLSEAVQFGVAVAAASVLHPGTELFRAEDAWGFYSQMREVCVDSE